MTSHLVWWPAQRGDKLRNILSCFAQFVTPELVMSWAPAPLFIVLSQKSSSNRGGPRYDYPPWWWRPAQRGDKLRNNLSCIAQFVTPELVMSWAPSTLFHSERPNRGSQIYDPASLEIKSKYSKKKKFNLSTPVRALSEGGLLYIVNRVQRPGSKHRARQSLCVV